MDMQEYDPIPTHVVELREAALPPRRFSQLATSAKPERQGLHPFWYVLFSSLICAGTFTALVWAFFVFLFGDTDLSMFWIAAALFSAPAALAYVIAGHHQKNIVGRYVLTPILPLVIAMVTVACLYGLHWREIGGIALMAGFMLGGTWSAAILQRLLRPSPAKRAAKKALKAKRH